MNILVLNGSPRKDGNTSKILKNIAEGIAQENTISWINVFDLSVKPCTGCLRCRPNKECVLTGDDAQIIGRKINEADVLIVGTPVYWGNMAGTLKNLFDRNVTTFEDFSAGRFPKPRQKGKKAIIVAASAAPWPFNGKGAVKSIKKVLRGGAYRISGIINYGGTALHTEIPPKVLQKAKRMGRAI
jgi:multimeric flavodoxin WrbA